MNVGAATNTNAGASGSTSMGDRFQMAMKAESEKSEGGCGAGGCTCGGCGSQDSATTGLTGASSSGSPANALQSMEGILTQMKELIQQLAQLIQAMSNKGGKISGASSIGADGRTKSVDGPGANGLGGTQGASERIPDPAQNVRVVQLGNKTMTIGSDGSASAAEVDSAVAEMQRMYDTSPTFRQMVDNSGAEDLTVTLGRRGDNTSWGGGGRVFLNLNNIEAGNNDRFQGIVGHEFAHAASGLGHGAELDSIEDRVRAEA